MSHLACAAPDIAPMDLVQAERFEAAAALFPGVPTSLGASAGLFLGERFRGQVVRPGITLYGGGPFQRPDARLRPVATLDAPILQVRSVAPGETVGYGAAYVAQRHMRVAVVRPGLRRRRLARIRAATLWVVRGGRSAPSSAGYLWT